MHANRPDGHPGGPGPDIRTRLRRTLTEALKVRDKDAVSALRSALSAIGNAEAVGPREPGSGQPAATGSAHFAGTVPFASTGVASTGAGLGAAEAQRRHLTEADVAAIVRAEAAEREAAASQYERAGHAGQVAGLRHGTRALLDALAAGDDGGVHT
jgi:hypothetical protein